MSLKSAAAHWKLSIPTVFQHYFHQLWIVTNAFFSLNVHFYILVFLRLCPNQQTRRYWLCTILQANLHSDRQRLSRTYAWVQLGRDVTRLYDRTFPADVFQCELRKSSLLFCSDLTGANQNVGHCLSMWDMRQGMEMLCSPTKKVEQMISEYFRAKMNSFSHPKLQ